MIANNDNMNITICGGGSLGHVVSGYLAAKENVSVSILTRSPQKWSRELEVIDNQGRTFRGEIACISSRPEDVIPQAHIVLLCLPGFGIEPTLRAIRPHLQPGSKVGTVVSSTGFFFQAHDILDETTPLFGFQRVPFIARTAEYGRRARLLGYKTQHKIAAEGMDEDEKQRFAGLIESLFDTPVALLNSHFEASLTNSNPLLHPARLYSLLHDWNEGDAVAQCPYFYREWNDMASQYYIAMDKEFQQLLLKLDVTEGSIPDVLTYYESHDVPSLTRKIRSIEAFQEILAPYRQREDGLWEPDFASRYFTEDFPFGTRFIVEVAREHCVSIPTIEKIYYWGMSLIK